MEDLLELLNMQDAGDEQRKKLQTIMDITSDRLKVKLGTDEVPAQLSYIVTEVSILRFRGAFFPYRRRRITQFQR